MTTTRIDATDLRAIFHSMARRIKFEEPRLNALDAAIGDGDHGITMRVGFDAVHSALDEMPPGASVSDVLNETGKTFMAGTGGAIGIILGRMFMAGGKALVSIRDIGPSELKMLLDAMEAGVVKAGKARPGDKTLLDPLHAACESLNSVSEGSLKEMLSRAADAATASAQATADMRCRIGRASRLGDRALGHQDPGAVSFSLIMRSMADWVQAKDGAAVQGM